MVQCECRKQLQKLEKNADALILCYNAYNIRIFKTDGVELPVIKKNHFSKFRQVGLRLFSGKIEHI